MKLAIVHDWIVTMGGAERTLKEMTRLWPDAPIYILFADIRVLHEHFPKADIRTSWMQRIPGIARIYPWLALLMPSAIESFDLSDFDTVLSSSVTFAKGVIVRSDTRHICYCYSPTRMLWDSSSAYAHFGRTGRVVRHVLRSWDAQAARRPDQMIAISQTVASRINTYYRRDAIIIPPPVSIPTSYKLPSTGSPYFVIVARLVQHKNLHVAIEAFNKLGYPLTIVGTGPLLSKLKRRAGGTITFAGAVSDEYLHALYDNCRAVIVPNEEDFGLTAVEAMAHGKPVLALRAGGATETVIDGITGEFFDDPAPEVLADGVRRIINGSYDAVDVQKQAARYSEDIFAQRMRALVQ